MNVRSDSGGVCGLTVIVRHCCLEFQARNKDTGRRLCLALKQFGLCHDERHCQQRHLVLDCDLVSDQEGQRLWPPADGIVKVCTFLLLMASTV